MTAKELDETLKTLIANGKGLREAGYTRLEVGDVTLELGAPEPASVTVQSPSGQDDTDPLNDANTFGGHIPMRRGAPRPTEDEE